MVFYGAHIKRNAYVQHYWTKEINNYIHKYNGKFCIVEIL